MRPQPRYWEGGIGIKGEPAGKVWCGMQGSNIYVGVLWSESMVWNAGFQHIHRSSLVRYASTEGKGMMTNGCCCR